MDTNKKLTIIIAMYNAEETIDATLYSIYPQPKVNSNLEVIVVDDGSKDSSREIVENWKNKLFTDITLLDGAHKGVSHARNIAINKAKGCYITFMDSDDRFSNNHFDGIINFFDSVYKKTDIVTYPLVYVNTYTEEDVNRFGFPMNQNKLEVDIDPLTHTAIYTKKMLAAKQKLFSKGTTVYDTNTMYWLGQKTVNVVIKNLRLDNKEQIYFDEDVPNGEDSMFMTRYVEHSNSIGYYNKNNFQYLYYRRGDSTVQKFLSPVDSYKMVMFWAHRLISATKDENGQISKYVQSIILDEFGWRIKSTNFFPKHLNNEEYAIWLNDLKAVLQYISISVLKRGLHPNPTMPRFILNMLIEIRGEVLPVPDAEGISFYQDNELILRERHFETILSGIEFQDNKLTINAAAKHYFSELYDVKPFYEINGEKHLFEETYVSSESYYMQKHKTHKLLGFKDTINLKNINQGTIKIGYLLDEYVYYPDLMFIRNSRLFADKLKLNVAIVDGVSFKIDYNNFTIEFNREVSQETMYQFNLGIADNQDNEIISDLTKYNLDDSQIIWLYSDTIGKTDNAFTQFMNDIRKDDGVIRKYIVHPGFESYIPNGEYNSEFILFGSDNHKKLFLNANVLVTAFQGVDTFSPYPKNEIDEVRGILNLNVVYLQHGLLHAKIDHIYSNERVDFYRKWVVSSQMEFDELVNNYHLNENQIILSGMPRFYGRNNNKIVSKKLKRILYAPSWRRNLMAGQSYKGSGWQPNEGLLKKSIIMNSIQNLFDNEDLNNWLKGQDVYIDVKLHPIMSDFVNIPNDDNRNVQLVSSIGDMGEYDLFITDYSSFMYDAVADNVPVLLFQPDYDYFVDGIHTFIDYVTPKEKTLADKVFTFSELFEKIQIMKSNPDVLNRHLTDYEGFLSVVDNPMEMIYSEIKKEHFNKLIPIKIKDLLVSDIKNKYIKELLDLDRLNFNGQQISIEIPKSVAVFSSDSLNPKTKLKTRIDSGTKMNVYGVTNRFAQPVIITSFGYINGHNAWIKYALENGGNANFRLRIQALNIINKIRRNSGSLKKLASKSYTKKIQEFNKSTNAFLIQHGLPAFIIQISKNESIKISISDVKWNQFGKISILNKDKWIQLDEIDYVAPRKDISKYITDVTDGMRVSANKDLNIYSGTTFNRLNRTKNIIKLGDIVDVLSIEWTKGGTPRLKTAMGYVSANVNNVSISNSGNQH